MSRVRAELAAIGCAAMVPAIALSVLQMAGDTTTAPTFESFLVWAALVYPVALVIMVAARCSVVVLLDRLGWTNAVTSMLAGAIAGGLALQVFAYPAPQRLETTVIYAGIGLLSGLMFWWIRLCFEE